MNFGCDALSRYSDACSSLAGVADSISVSLDATAYLTGVSIFALLFLLSVACSTSERQLSRALLWVFPLILFGRFPWWRLNELNPDEGFVGAVTLALYRDPVYWRSITGVTHGPLVHYITLVPALFGLRVDYASMRCVGALLLAGGSYMVLRGLSRSVHRLALVVGAIPVLLFLSIAPFWDYQAYNGEQPLLFVIAGALAIFYRLLGEAPENRRRLIFLMAAVVGLLPLVKIQGGPTGAVILACAFCVYAQQQGLKVWLRDGAIVVMIAISPALVVLGLGSYFGVLTELYNSSIAFNLFYVGRTNQSLFSKALSGTRLLSEEPVARQFLWSSACLLLMGGLIGLPFMRWALDRKLAMLLASLLFVLVSWATVVLPGNGFHHYVMLISIPLMTASVLAFDAFISRRRGRWGDGFVGGIFATIFCYSVYSIYVVAPQVGAIFATDIPEQRDGFFREAVQGVVSVSEAKDSLLVWGWSEWLYVRAGLPPASKYSSIFLTIQPSVLRPYFVSEYESDIRSRQPAVIAEAIGPGLFLNAPKEEIGLQSSPAVARFVREHYFHWGSVGSINLFVRKNRERRLMKLLGHIDVRDFLARAQVREAYPEQTRRILGDLLQNHTDGIDLQSLFRELRHLDRLGAVNAEQRFILESEALLEARARISSKCLVDLAECH